MSSLLTLLFAGTSYAQTPEKAATAKNPPSIMRIDDPAPPSIALSPAVVTERVQLGQTITETMVLANNTAKDYAYEMVAQDVVVRDGKRTFVPAGNLPNSIAQSAQFTPKSGIIKAHTSGAAVMRLTVPPRTDIRAVVAIFRTLQPQSSGAGTVGMTASLGCLVTFNISDSVALTSGPVKAAQDVDRGALVIETTLNNSGAEPVIPGGVAAILDATGKLAGKAKFEPQRLLPGERLQFRTEYAGQLKPGTYRVLCSFEFEGKQLTSTGTVTVE